MTDLRYRDEMKFLISRADALVLRSRLSCILSSDPNAGPDGRYRVRSLYFDTPEDKALLDKMDGAPLKEKYRIRFYNGDDAFIWLEKKVKHYGKGAKVRVRITKQDVLRILTGDTRFLRESGEPLFRDFYVRLLTERLLPRIVVDYTREAYFHPAGNVRVTLDADIRTSVGRPDPFDPHNIMVPVFEDNKYVLEVKFDRWLPEFVEDLIQVGKTMPTSVSKYAACRAYA